MYLCALHSDSFALRALAKYVVVRRDYDYEVFKSLFFYDVRTESAVNKKVEYGPKQNMFLNINLIVSRLA